MSNPGLLDGAFDAFDDSVSTSTSGSDRFEFAQASRHSKAAGMPAWKRIEELREMRELNRHISDVYGSKPVLSLWGE